MLRVGCGTPRLEQDRPDRLGRAARSSNREMTLARVHHVASKSTANIVVVKEGRIDGRMIGIGILYLCTGADDACPVTAAHQRTSSYMKSFSLTTLYNYLLCYG